MSHTAELIAVGTEILLGNIANTDAQMLSEELAALGVNVLYHTVVGDNPTRLAEALELARRRVDILITTGGLGPTYDDLTKQTICTVFGRKNIFHPEIADALRTHFASIGRELTENNLRQAYLPEGCTIFHNHNGTAPGCGFCEGGVHVLMLPGPPHECRKMFRTGAIPYLRTLSDEIIVSHSLRIYGQGESQIEAMLHDRIASMVNPSVAPYAKPDECMLRVTAKAKSEAEAEEMLRGAIEEVMPVIGEWVYGIDVGSLEEVVSALLREKGRTLAAAESCTGGLIAKRVTGLHGRRRELYELCQSERARRAAGSARRARRGQRAGRPRDGRGRPRRHRRGLRHLRHRCRGSRQRRARQRGRHRLHRSCRPGRDAVPPPPFRQTLARAHPRSERQYGLRPSAPRASEVSKNDRAAACDGAK